MELSQAFSDAEFSPEGDAPAEADPEMSLEQFLNGVVEVTIAVLTRQPEKKGEWWNALNQFYAQARRHADQDRMTFFDALRQLVEGASPVRLSPSIPEAFHRHWQAILDGITA
jgi:hypothetical protein